MSADLAAIADELRVKRAGHARIVVTLDRAIEAIEESLTVEEKSAQWLRGFEGVASGRGSGQRADGDPEGRGETAPASRPAVHPEPAASDRPDPGSVTRRPDATPHAPGCWRDDRGVGADGAGTPAVEVPAEVATAPTDVLDGVVPAPEPVAVADRTTVDYAEVARVAREAHADDLPMRNAVAEHFSITAAAAGMRIRIARARGHHIPEGKTTPRSGATAPRADSTVRQLNPPKAVTDPSIRPRAPVVLVCEDCGLEFATDRYLDLRDHVNMEHNRKVRNSERTPRPREVSA